MQKLNLGCGSKSKAFREITAELRFKWKGEWNSCFCKIITEIQLTFYLQWEILYEGKMWDVKLDLRGWQLFHLRHSSTCFENFFNENKHSDFVQLITQIFALSCRHDFAKLTSTEQCDSHLNVKLLRVIRPKKLESACIENKQDLNRTKWVCL